MVSMRGLADICCRDGDAEIQLLRMRGKYTVAAGM